MPTPIPQPIREAILCRVQQNQDAATIAQALDLCPRTVRHLIRRFRQHPNAVEPSYRPGPGRPKDSQNLRDRAVALHEEHPTWGAGYIRVRMSAPDQQNLPSERTLQRWFRQSALSPAPPGRRPASDERRAQEPHDVWQMDAVDQLRLGGGQQVSWLRLVDECSGVVLQTTIFPPALLESGAARSRAGDVAPGFFAVGTAQTLPGRQRYSLGIGRRLAHRPGAVVDRFGRGDDLESRSDSARQWRGRAVARHG